MRYRERIDGSAPPKTEVDELREAPSFSFSSPPHVELSEGPSLLPYL